MSEPLTLRDALRIANAPLPDSASSSAVGLACSFTPLHLQTFLLAYLRSARPELPTTVQVGHYGDVVASMRTLARQQLNSCAVVLEWPDLDPRLGLRENITGRRTPEDDVIDTATQRVERIRTAISQLAMTI